MPHTTQHFIETGKDIVDAMQGMATHVYNISAESGTEIIKNRSLCPRASASGLAKPSTPG